MPVQGLQPLQSHRHAAQGAFWEAQPLRCHTRQVPLLDVLLVCEGC
jgi:hypothetical protein